MFKLKSLAIILSLSFVVGLMVTPSPAFASLKSDACTGINTLQADSCSATASNTISGLLVTVINILSIVVGFSAVLMIIVGGFKYITAAGDSGKLANARSTILYSIIGLVIVAMAQVIVHFTLAKASSVTTVCTKPTQKNCIQKSK